MSVYRSAHGNWMVEVAHRDPTTRKAIRIRRVSPVNTKAGALKYELQVRAALQDGTFETKTEAPTLLAFSADYLNYSDANNRARTVREKRATFRRAILPALGKLRIDAIGPRELETFKASRVKAGLHAKTVNDEVALVVSALRLAVEWGLITAAPKVRKLKVPPSAFDFLTFEEADRLNAAPVDEPWATMILVAMRTGLRRGELRALRWVDVDLAAKRLVVRQALDDRGAVEPPKNGRARDIPLSDDTLAALRAHRHLRGGLVFCNPDGSAFTQRQLERPIARACARAGLRAIGWHVLRHTFASHLVMRGASLKVVQELGGWATISMVLRYAHLSPDARRDAVQLLDPRTTKGKADEG